MRERKQRMEDLSDGFAVVPGGIGTLEEFFEIFTLRQLGRHPQAYCMLNVNGYFDKLVELLKHTVSEGLCLTRSYSSLASLKEPGQLIDYLIENSED